MYHEREPPCDLSEPIRALLNTGWIRLIRSHSSAQFSFELSGNSNYNYKLLLFTLMFEEVMSTFKRKLRIKCKIRINRIRINRTQPVDQNEGTPQLRGPPCNWLRQITWGVRSRERTDPLPKINKFLTFDSNSTSDS